ncbi:MAG TPA: hypothetical protein DEO59_08595 [Balneola sp.]|jgi:hypothetical protein|nr:hypothetical protein [Balneola sp.]MAO77488.1 hypothetical protein [Balneola sp.]MBF65997.1 hypothetical protein [Balneola sp.]HBZ38525.1 hypothetical protein [Balneola sp.]|tara:strand:+ start:942 stop:2261 length:1320 start_codon:yes stop_codon:yes gene_type:complete
MSQIRNFAKRFENTAMVACLLVPLWFCVVSVPIEAQEVEIETPTRLAFFLDCNFCDETFIRQEMPYLDHVRDREVADIHVLVTREDTGSGGEAWTIDVFGLGAFEGQDLSGVYNIPADVTEAEERNGFLRTLEVSLVPYLMQTPIRDRLSVDIAPSELDAVEQTQITEDPWNHWTFEIYADGSADFESQQQSFDTRYGVYASHVTEKWKLQLRPFFNYNYDQFERDQGTITSTAQRNGFTSYAIRSISPHWSVGAYGDILTSTFSNVDLRYRFMGAVEWSHYPYREANRRQLTVAYRLGASQITYRDTTIYNEIEQRLPQHLLNAGYEVVQPWGAIEIGINASQYLHDLSRHSLLFDAEFDIRITKGLSVGIGGFFELIHDQINLPKGSADLEDVLLRRRQLETNFEAGIGFGFRYRFGSVLNNVVNPRFGGIGNRDRF